MSTIRADPRAFNNIRSYDYPILTAGDISEYGEQLTHPKRVHGIERALG